MEKIKVEQSASLSGARISGKHGGWDWLANLTRDETETLISELRAVLDAPKFPEPEGRYAVVHVWYFEGMAHPALFEKFLDGWNQPGSEGPKSWTEVIDGAVRVAVLFPGFPADE